MAAQIMANETFFLNRITQAEDYIDEDNAKNDKNDLENKSTYLFYTHTYTYIYIYIYIYIYVYMLFCISSILVYYFCITSVFLLL